MLYSFNWWYVFSPALLGFVAVVSGLRHRRHHCRPLKDRYGDLLPHLIGIAATFTFAALVLIESHDGLLELGNSTLAANEDPVWALVPAGMAFAFGVFGYYALTRLALRLGNYFGRELMLRHCRQCRARCRHSIVAAQSCPMQAYKAGCPVGVKFTRFSLERSPSLMSNLQSQVDQTGHLNVPYIIQVEHPRGKIAYSTLLPDGQLRPLMQERRQNPSPRQMPNWLLHFDDQTPTEPVTPTQPAVVEVVPQTPPAKAAEPRVVFTEAGMVQKETPDGVRLMGMAARRMVVTTNPQSEGLFDGLRELND